MNVKFKPFLLQFGPGCLAVWRTRGSYLVIIYILPMIAVLFTVITRGHLYAKDDRYVQGSNL